MSRRDVVVVDGPDEDAAGLVALLVSALLLFVGFVVGAVAATSAILWFTKGAL